MSGGSTWARQEAEIDRLRAELVEANAFATMEHGAWQTMNDRREIAEAAIARVRALCGPSRNPAYAAVLRALDAG